MQKFKCVEYIYFFKVVQIQISLKMNFTVSNAFMGFWLTTFAKDSSHAESVLGLKSAEPTVTTV